MSGLYPEGEDGSTAILDVMVTCEECGEAEQVVQRSQLGASDFDPDVCPSCGGEWDPDTIESA